MEFGVHLPQIGWEDQEPAGLDRLIEVATAAERLGFGTITANDHLVYGRPWLDGPTALAAVLAAAPTVRLMTSVSLPVVRGPFALAKSLGAIDMLSGGRLDAGLGPGSSEADYRLGGHPVRRALGAVRRSGRRHARAVGRRRSPVRRAVLRHVGRRSSAAAPGSAEGTADLDRQLGLDRRPPSCGPARGRLAGVRLQHDPGVLRDGLADAQRHARGGGSRSVHVPVDDGHDLAVRHRRRGGGASRPTSV